jgi:predicted acylesterase/phospholipase RssA
MDRRRRHGSAPIDQGHSYIPYTLVLGGGGPLGAFEAGVVDELAPLLGAPRGIVGVSTGAINGAYLASYNRADYRKATARLVSHWEHPHKGLLSTHAFPVGPWALFLKGASSARARFSSRSPSLAEPAVFGPADSTSPAPGVATQAQIASQVYGTTMWGHAKMYEHLHKFISRQRVVSSDMPLAYGAVRCDTGAYVPFEKTNGDFWATLTASCALYPLFTPVPVPGYGLMVDGGYRCPVPVEQVMDRSEDLVVIAHPLPRGPGGGWGGVQAGAAPGTAKVAAGFVQSLCETTQMALLESSLELLRERRPRVSILEVYPDKQESMWALAYGNFSDDLRRDLVAQGRDRAAQAHTLFRARR